MIDLSDATPGTMVWYLHNRDKLSVMPRGPVRIQRRTSNYVYVDGVGTGMLRSGLFLSERAAWEDIKARLRSRKKNYGTLIMHIDERIADIEVDLEIDEHLKSLKSES